MYVMKAKRTDITAEFLTEILIYDKDSGILRWKQRPLEMFKSANAGRTWNTRFSGAEALCCPNGNGYFHGRILGIGFLAHKVAWAIHYGQWPSFEIDHINGKRTDNSIQNLRDVSSSQNRRNSAFRSDNTSGFCGVYWDKDLQKWRSAMGMNGKSIHIGVYENIQDAADARVLFQKNAGFSDRHGLKLSLT